ncbi:hypothetical protein AXI59_01095 [Bacillus nakamurai]|uniref:YjdJ family protein n=1 Tax=Bacillus nakamurai TaxID=1793963 RepID=UPI000778223A|nr:YjdJ family protein [Bacillus nakamurai]KXZ17877.1 hypothetical protein AXI59_01095 [Bacillus nakamurai]
MKSIFLIVQCAFSVFCFFCLAVVNWYQGSELVSDSFDWNYTAKFSKLLNGTDTITSPEQISQLDFFIYSAKHYPFVSGLMVCLFIYILFSLFLVMRDVRRHKLNK